MNKSTVNTPVNKSNLREFRVISAAAGIGQARQRKGVGKFTKRIPESIFLNKTSRPHKLPDHMEKHSFKPYKKCILMEQAFYVCLTTS